MVKFDEKILIAVWGCHDKYYAVNQWIGPLKSLFKKTITFDPKEQIFTNGKNNMNAIFLKKVEEEKPDYILFWLIYDEFYIEIYEKIRKLSPRTKLINFFGDDDTAFDNISKYKALFFDYNLVFQIDYLNRYKKEGVRGVFPFIGASTSIYRPIEASKEYEVVFIGTPKSNRYESIKYLLSNGVNIKIAGAGWEKYPEFASIWFGKLTVRQSVEIINKSKINLSFTRNYLDKLHFNSRIFEVMASKSFVISEYFDGYAKLFKNDKEIVMFKDNKDLLDKIRYYLKNDKEREQIADNGYNRTLKFFSYQKQLKYIFQKIRLNKSKIKPIKEIKLNVAYLEIQDIKKNINTLKKELLNYDYVAFKEKNNISSDVRNFFQILSLLKSKKNISCCDYYIWNKNLGDYLCFTSFYAFEKSDVFFNKIANPYQIMVEKKYFIDNLESFRRFIQEGKTLMTKTNTTIVSIPLVKIYSSNFKQKIIYRDNYLVKFENNLTYLLHKKIYLLPSCVLNLLIYSGQYRLIILKSLKDILYRFLRKYFL